MKRATFCLLFFIICINPLYAEENASLQESVREGIELIYNLDYAEAQEIFDKIKNDHPESPVGYGLTALNAWNQVLFASRNLAVYEHGRPTPFGTIAPTLRSDMPELMKFHAANQTLEDICEKRLAENPRDAQALYFKGMSYENLSTLALTYGRKWTRAKNDAKTAEKLHQQALAVDPSLIDAKTSTAVIKYVVGSLNVFLRLGARLFFGLKGDKEGAVENLREVGEKGLYRAKDARSVLALLQAWKGDPQIAISILSELQKEHPRSFLIDISLAATYKDAAKDAKSAIRVYEELLQNISLKAPGVFPGEIHFRIANCYVQLRDYSLALEQFQKALEAERGDAETEPLAHYNMALIYEERGEKELAKECYQSAVSYSGPTDLIEKEIKQARKKAK